MTSTFNYIFSRFLKSFNLTSFIFEKTGSFAARRHEAFWQRPESFLAAARGLFLQQPEGFLAAGGGLLEAAKKPDNSWSSGRYQKLSSRCQIFSGQLPGFKPTLAQFKPVVRFCVTETLEVETLF